MIIMIYSQKVNELAEKSGQRSLEAAVPIEAFFISKQHETARSNGAISYGIKSGQRPPDNCLLASCVLAYRSFYYIQTMQNGEVNPSNFP